MQLNQATYHHTHSSKKSRIFSCWKRFSFFFGLSLLPLFAIADPEQKAPEQTFLASDLTVIGSGSIPYYYDKKRDALAINAAIKTHRNQVAEAEMTFSGKPGGYRLSLTTLGETDGECLYTVLVNGQVIGIFRNEPTEKDRVPQVFQTAPVILKTGDIIKVASAAHTNGKIPEGDGTAWARGRWRSISVFGE